MTDSDRKPEKIDLAEILGSLPDATPEQGDVVLLDPSTGEPLGGAALAAEAAEAVRAARAEKEKYYDLWIRARADFENLRKRVERERDEESARASAPLIKDLLPVADNLERAVAVAPADDPVRKGIEIVHRQLMDCLARAGLEPIDAIGAVFNPLYHEAVVSEATDRIEPNRVLEEIQKGYTFKGRVLRPSLVKVSVAAGGTPGQETRGGEHPGGSSSSEGEQARGIRGE